MKKQSGFTLVEIAIVIVIVGLMIGGIMKGQTVIESSKRKSFVTACKNIDAAITNFESKYLGLPGDISSPSTRLPNCTAGPCDEVGNMDRYIMGAGGAANTSATSPIVVDEERMAAWGQLYAAGLVSGIDGTANIEFGRGLPENGYNGGFTIGFQNAVSADFDITSQNVLRTITGLNSTTGAFTNTGSIFSPAAAAAIDRMADDGLPNRGIFQANTTAVAAATDCRATATTYREASEVATCGFLYLLSTK